LLLGGVYDPSTVCNNSNIAITVIVDVSGSKIEKHTPCELK